MKKLFSLIVALILLNVAVIKADVETLPTVELDGQHFFYYEVKKDDSLYGISKKYGWNLDTLLNTNNLYKKDLIRGMILYYPAPSDNKSIHERREKQTYKQIARNDATTHLVKKGETIYGLAMKYGISTDALYAANPRLKNGLKAGESIKIPASTGTAAVETIHKGDATPKVESPVVADIEKTVEKKSLDTKERVDSKVADSFRKAEIDEMPVVGEISANHDSRTQDVIPTKKYDNEVKVLLLLSEPHAKKELEFARGMLVGVDALKNASYRIGFKIVDGSKSIQSLKDSITEYNPEIIISTSDNFPTWMGEIADETNAKVVNVFDVKSELFRDNNNVIQLITPSNYFNNEVVEYVTNRFPQYNLVIVGEIDDNDAILENLKAVYPLKKTVFSDLESLSTMPIVDGENYLLYCPETKWNEMQKFITESNQLCERAMFSNFAILTRPNMVLYDSELKKSESKCDIYVPSRYYFDMEGESEKKFNNSFNTIFGHNPYKSFPVYAVEGYDVSRYFIPSYAAKQGELQGANPGVESLQGEIYLQQYPGNKGLVNTSCYMLMFKGGSNELNKIIIGQ